MSSANLFEQPSATLEPAFTQRVKAFGVWKPHRYFYSCFIYFIVKILNFLYFLFIRFSLFILFFIHPSHMLFELCIHKAFGMGNHIGYILIFLFVIYAILIGYFSKFLLYLF